MEGHVLFLQALLDLGQEDPPREVLEIAADVDVRDAADGHPVVVVALLVDVDGHFGHRGREDAVDGPHAFGLELDVVAVHVEVELVRPDVHEVAVRVRLGDGQDVDSLEQGPKVAEGQVPDDPEDGLFRRLLVAVLGGREEDRRLGRVEGPGGRGPVLGEGDEVDVPGAVRVGRKRPPDDGNGDVLRQAVKRAQEGGDGLALAVLPVSRLLGRRLQ